MDERFCLFEKHPLYFQILLKLEQGSKFNFLLDAPVIQVDLVLDASFT